MKWLLITVLTDDPRLRRQTTNWIIIMDSVWRNGHVISRSASSSLIRLIEPYFASQVRKTSQLSLDSGNAQLSTHTTGVLLFFDH